MEETAGIRTRVAARVELPAKDSIEKLTIRGLEIGPMQLSLIQEVLQKSAGRTQASKELCKVFQYYQPNGWLKERAMRDILGRLASRGLIKLPVPLSSSGGAPTRRLAKLAVDESRVDALSGVLRVERVQSKVQSVLWDHLISEHHYLGRKTVVGRNLKQMVYDGDRPLACLAWADPCLRLAPRDEFLRQSGMAEPDPQRGINNTRFLLLPWVTVPNLASQLLSLAIRHARDHWNWYYHADLLWAETFVDPSRFSGTCYLAANWSLVGTTKGTARSGSSSRRVAHGQEKHILIYRFSRRRKRVG